MPSEKRARQREARAQKQAVIQRRRKRRATFRRGLVFFALAAVIVLIVVLIQSGGKPKKLNTAATTTTSTTVAATTSTTAGKVGTTPCPPAAGSKTRKLVFNGPPKDCIGKTSVWDATFDTTKGTFVVRMEAAKSYAAVNNFVFLTRYRYYDGTFFNRIIPGFVDQGGDPSGTGTGGPLHYPGYSFTGNAPPASCTAAKDCYATGDVAMANTGSSPTTDGSQFFIIVPGGAAQLGPDYTDFGHVISGLPIVEKINALGTPGQTGTPKVKVYITSLTVKQAAG